MDGQWKNMQQNGNEETNSQDDLFRILARPSFDEIREMHAEHKWKYREKHGEYPSTENIAFMKHHGWTWFEFLREQHNRKLPGRLI